MKILNFKNVLVVILSTLMAGCSGESNQQDLKNHVANQKAKVQENKLNKPKIELTRMNKVSYSAKYKSPFDVTAKIVKNNKSIDPLTIYSLNELDFVGTIKEGAERSGVVVTPKGMSYKVKIGDEIGDHFGKIISINKKFLKIKVSYTQASGNTIEKTVKLQLKDER